MYQQIIAKLQQESSIGSIFEQSKECLLENYPSSLIKYCATRCLSAYFKVDRKENYNECFFTHNLSLEGASYALLNNIYNFSLSADSITLLSPIDGELKSDFQKVAQKIEVYTCLQQVNPSTLSEMDNLIDKIVIILTSISPNKVIINTTRGWIFSLACKKLNIEYSWWIHEAETPFNFIEDKSIRKKAIQSFKNTKNLVFVSQATMERYCKTIGISKSNCSIYRPSKLRDIFQFANDEMNTKRGELKRTARESLKINHKKICIVNIGTICKRKNQLELLKSIQSINPSSLENIKVLLIGNQEAEPEYAQKLKKIATELNCSCVSADIVDFVKPTPNVLTYFLCADYYIHTSTFECFSQTVNEARALQLEIIVRDCEGMDEVLAGYSKAITYNKSSQLSSIITKLITD